MRNIHTYVRSLFAPIPRKSIKRYVPRRKWRATLVMLRQYARKRRLQFKMGFGWANTFHIKTIVARRITSVATLQPKE
jgi:hypothetical protein